MSDLDTPASYGSPKATAQAGQLGYLPVALFGSVMGLAGLSSAWRLAHRMYGMPLWIAQLIGVLAVLAFLMIGFGYAVKWVTGPDAVKAEFNHPIAGNLFGTLFISLLLLPIPLADLSVPFARAVWIVGAIGMIVFAWFVIMRWLSQRQHTLHAHAVPAHGARRPVALSRDHLPLPALVVGPITHGIAIFLLATVTPLLLLLAARTLWGVLRGELEALAH
ncbi:hypothetical protein [Paraburkholderia sp. CNPSo 3281]|uniref:SLAC1 family transporter n=1 Tax=Paraburkholderia sp. CNPSo 3281 TaxID=2940933 RepID=UPI0020B79E44|nr:hypothetical protein [Paraburkholderia sp. CNPSo 3281]MCP3717175.1 hypothetical protein [Paraburkholderia sp. CNPSo 3281]